VPLNIFPKVRFVFYFWLLVAGTNSPRKMVERVLSHCIELKPFFCSIRIRDFPNYVSRKVLELKRDGNFYLNSFHCSCKQNIIRFTVLVCIPRTKF